MKMKLAFLFTIIVGAYFIAGRTAFAGELEVSFKTEDGWTIYGALSLPENVQGKVPVVILLPSADHDRAAFSVYRYPGQYQYPGVSPVINRKGVATLSLDPRGQGKSVGKGEIDTLGPHELSKSYLDVRAAISFLSSQSKIDPSRIGIVAEGASAEAALKGCDGDERVRSMAFISGRLSEETKKLIAATPETPLLLVVSSEDKKSFVDMTDAYFASANSETAIEIYEDLGIGTAMFSVFRYKFPKEKPLQDSIGEWIADQILLTGQLAEVSFRTEDGWTIYANLRLPMGRGEKVPAVVLFHSGLSDRYAYHDLEIALAKAGLAALNLDWRGKGKSTGKGKYFEVSKEERDRGYLDAKAAVNFLASQPNIDANRIGVIGTVIGAKYAMAALPDDPRIKTAVVLTGYIPTEKEKAYLVSNQIPVLYITSRGHTAVTKALTDLYNLSKDKGSELLLYNGGAIGYQLFELDHSLLPRVAQWMRSKLGA